MLSCFDPEEPVESAALTVNELVPASVGVPEIVFPLRLSPAGSVPLLMDQE